MVGRILNLINKEISGIHQAAFLMGFLTLASQILALARNRILAHSFGAGEKLDVYYASFLVPDFLFATIASLVSISILIPFFTGIFDKKKEEARELMDTVFTMFMIVMVVAAIIAWIAMPWLSKLLLGGIKDPAFFEMNVKLARILLLQPIFLGISNLLAVVTQISKRFFLYSVGPVLYNLAIIFGIVALYPIFGLTGIAMGVVGGGLLHFLVQVPFVISKGLLPRLTYKPDLKVIKHILQLSIPRTITLSASSLELIFITGFASLITTGSIAVFNLSLNLQSVPFAIVSVSYAMAAFPLLAGFYERGQKAEFMDHIVTAARHIIFWSIPISVLFIVLRAQVVRTILGTGSFNWDDTRLTAACLAMFTVSLVAQGLELLFIRAYYAAGQTKKPLLINFWSSIITIGAPYLLLIVFNSWDTFRFFIEALLKISDVPGSAVVMLPLGFTLGSIVNALVFWIIFEKEFGQFTKRVLPTLLHSVQASVVGGFVAYVALNLFGRGVFDQDTLPGIFSQGFLAGLLGIAAIIGVLKLLKSQEIDEVLSTLLQKVSSRNKVIVTEIQKIES